MQKAAAAGGEVSPKRGAAAGGGGGGSGEGGGASSPGHSRSKFGNLRSSKSKQKFKSLGESVEYPADDEEIPNELETADNVITNTQTDSPDQPRRGHAQEAGFRRTFGRGKGSPGMHKRKMVSFEEGLESDHTPLALSDHTPQVVVPVEVHVNEMALDNHAHLGNEVKSKLRSLSSSSQDHSPSYSSFASHSPDSHDASAYQRLSPNRMLDISITSETKLLPDSESSFGNGGGGGGGESSGGSNSNSPASRRRLKRSKSPSLSSVKKILSLSQPTVQGDEEQMLLEQSGEGGGGGGGGGGSGGGGSPYLAWGSSSSQPCGVKGTENSSRAARAFSWDRRPSSSSTGSKRLSAHDCNSDSEA